SVPAFVRTRATMSSGAILTRFDELNVWKQGDQRAPHKPLLVLYALGRWQGSGRKRPDRIENPLIPTYTPPPPTEASVAVFRRGKLVETLPFSKAVRTIHAALYPDRSRFRMNSPSADDIAARLLDGITADGLKYVLIETCQGGNALFPHPRA